MEIKDMRESLTPEQIKEILERSPNASYDQVKQLLDERYSIQSI